MAFTFTSTNSHGTNRVRKIVAYIPLMRHGKQYFNLEFGDYKPKSKVTDYSSITDNGDMRKVLKTVASTLELFFDERPDDTVHFDGIDSTRHAYYQKLIRDYYKFIVPLYEVRGCVEGKLEPFKAGIDYDFIAVTKRKL